MPQFWWEEEDMKEGLKPWGERITWPLNSGVEYAGVFSQYAEEGTERRETEAQNNFLKEFIHFKLWGSAHVVKQVFGWLLRFFICCGFFVYFLVSQVKACTATWWFIVIFVLYFLKHDFLVKKACFPTGFINQSASVTAFLSFWLSL